MPHTSDGMNMFFREPSESREVGPPLVLRVERMALLDLQSNNRWTL